MANDRNFRNLFVRVAQTVIFFMHEREKCRWFSNLLEIFHRKPDSFLSNVERFDLYAYLITDGKHFRGVLDEFF